MTNVPVSPCLNDDPEMEDIAVSGSAYKQGIKNSLNLSVLVLTSTWRIFKGCLIQIANHRLWHVMFYLFYANRSPQPLSLRPYEFLLLMLSLLFSQNPPYETSFTGPKDAFPFSNNWKCHISLLFLIRNMTFPKLLER